MELLLSGDEGFIGLFVEGDIPKNGSGDEGSDLFNLNDG